MTFRIGLILAALFASVPAFGTISYTCAPSINTATCTYLNTTVAGYYNSTFTNADATIYITMGSTDLGESTTGYQNPVTYTNYVDALEANSDKDSLQTSALTALNTYDDSAYGSGDVNLTSALAAALGITTNALGSSITGMEASGSPCSDPGDGASSTSCYNGMITLSNSANFYYDNLGGSEAPGQYDFYAVVQHETDEVLGTASCMTTTSSTLQDGCTVGTDEPSAVDLYRYNGAGQLALMSACVGTTGCPAGAYFSYDGGATNGANGFVYNTEPNGDDYADFVFNGCTGPISIQDGVSCGGSGTPTDQGLTILNDGGAEVNILNAVGFDLAAPEPGTISLLFVGFSILAGLAYRRRLISNKPQALDSRATIRRI